MLSTSTNPPAKDLREMGYNEDIISLATADSTTGSFEEVLGLLKKNKLHYKLKLAKKNGNIVEFKPSAEGPKEVVNFLDSVSADIQKIHSERLMHKKDLQEIVRHLIALVSRNPNDYLEYIMKALTAIQDNLSKSKIEPRQYFNDPENLKFSSHLKCTIFNYTIRASQMNTEYGVEFPKLEGVVLLGLKLDMMTEAQMETFLSVYNRLCSRKGVAVNDHFVQRILEVYPELAEKSPELAKGVILLQKLEEAKINHRDNENNKVEEATLDIYCIICMEGTRDTIFMPCWHLVACDGCSKKMIKCPICTKVVERYQKIYWS